MQRPLFGLTFPILVVRRKFKRNISIFIKFYYIITGKFAVGYFDFINTVDENGVFMQLASFSLIFILKFSNTEEEILDELGPEMVNKYRFRRWP